MKIPSVRINILTIFFSHVFVFWTPKTPQEKNAGGKDKDALGWALKVPGCVDTDLGVGAGGFNITPKGTVSLSLCIDNMW